MCNNCLCNSWICNSCHHISWPYNRLTISSPSLPHPTTTPFTINSATEKYGIESCAVTLDFLISFAEGLPKDWTTAQVWCVSIMCARMLAICACVSGSRNEC